MKRVIIHMAAIAASAVISAACSTEPAEEIYEPVFNEFVLNNAVQSNMVIQQECTANVWGEANSGANIEVSVSWGDKTFTVKTDSEGFWNAEIPVPKAPPANPAQWIKASDGTKTLECTDILIGDVWFCSGQSNMEMFLKPNPPYTVGVENWQQEIAASDVPLLRHITMRRKDANTPQWNSTGKWEVCSPSTSGELSAVGYYFARKVIEETGIPIGVVITAVGGMSAQIYTSEKVLAGDPLLKDVYLDPYLANPAKVEDIKRPSKLYNAMIHPFFPIKIKGILWFQGDTNEDDYNTYALLETRKLADWRQQFGSDAIPYYFVQLNASYLWGASPSEPHAYYIHNMALVREAQAEVREMNTNCEMIVTLDCGNPYDMHPPVKRPLGERLARIALNRDYGHTAINYKGPRYNSHRVENGIVKVKFDNCTGGLETSDGLEPKHFMVSGADKRLRHPQTVEIKGDEVWLTYPGINVVAVRYAFLTCPETNLQNSDGLPAEPFRTDDWTSVQYLQQ